MLEVRLSGGDSARRADAPRAAPGAEHGGGGGEGGGGGGGGGSSRIGSGGAPGARARDYLKRLSAVAEGRGVRAPTAEGSSGMFSNIRPPFEKHGGVRGGRWLRGAAAQRAPPPADSLPCWRPRPSRGARHGRGRASRRRTAA